MSRTFFLKPRLFNKNEDQFFQLHKNPLPKKHMQSLNTSHNKDAININQASSL